MLEMPISTPTPRKSSSSLLAQSLVMSWLKEGKSAHHFLRLRPPTSIKTLLLAFVFLEKIFLFIKTNYLEHASYSDPSCAGIGCSSPRRYLDSHSQPCYNARHSTRCQEAHAEYDDKVGRYKLEIHFESIAMVGLLIFSHE